MHLASWLLNFSSCVQLLFLSFVKKKKRIIVFFWEVLQLSDTMFCFTVFGCGFGQKKKKCLNKIQGTSKIVLWTVLNALVCPYSVIYHHFAIDIFPCSSMYVCMCVCIVILKVVILTQLNWSLFEFCQTSSVDDQVFNI